jgi:hypothetical protein
MKLLKTLKVKSLKPGLPCGDVVVAEDVVDVE